MQNFSSLPEMQLGSLSDQGYPPICLPSEREALNARFQEIAAGQSSLLIVEIQNYFSASIDLKFIASLMLTVNALAMWKTCSPVTRLLVLSGDVSEQPLGMLYAFANEFRSLMDGGFGRIDNIKSWIDRLGISAEQEPVDLRDFRRAVRVFSAARLSPDDVPSLSHVEWYFAFASPIFGDPALGHCSYKPLGSQSARIANGENGLDLEFASRFNSGRCEILATDVRYPAYKVSLDLSGTHAPFDSTESVRYLTAFSGLI